MNRQETLALLKRIKTVLKHSRHIWVTAISESRLYLPTTFSSYLIMSNVFSRSRAEKKTLPFVHKHTFLHNILQCDLKTFFDLSAWPRVLTRDRGAVRELAVSPAIIKLTFCRDRVWNISDKYLYNDLIIHVTKSSTGSFNWVPSIALLCRASKIVTYRFIHHDPIQGDIVI